MSIENIIGLILAGIALLGLLTLLFLTTIPLSQIEKKERVKRCKMYDAITRYFNELTDYENN